MVSHGIVHSAGPRGGGGGVYHRRIKIKECRSDVSPLMFRNVPGQFCAAHRARFPCPQECYSLSGKWPWKQPGIVSALLTG